MFSTSAGFSPSHDTQTTPVYKVNKIAESCKLLLVLLEPKAGLPHLVAGSASPWCAASTPRACHRAKLLNRCKFVVPSCKSKEIDL